MEPFTDDHAKCSMINKLETTLKKSVVSKIFYNCNFLILGEWRNPSREQVLVEKLLQRGRATIYFDINETINYILLLDPCHPDILRAADTVSTHHPLGPLVVSIPWIIQSWIAEKLLPAHGYRPRVLEQTLPIKKEEKQKDVPMKVRMPLSIFRGSLFALLRIAPPKDALDFDSKSLTQDIVNHGGQMITEKLIDALRADQNHMDRKRRRTCFVVVWGGFSQTHISMHLLLSQIQKDNLCDMKFISPIWLKACITEKRLIGSIHQYPMLFQPQPWPFFLLSPSIKIAISGYTGAERTALVELIRSVGASYSEAMKPSNSHLVCKTAKGEKYEKALEWKIHVVSIEWLLHVIRFDIRREAGCETRFSLSSEINHSC
jgi:twin BRCT domain